MDKDINSVAVLGSGTMGAGIAALAADNNCKVLLLDISEDVVKKGKERIVNEKKPLLSDLEKINNVVIGTFENDFHKIKNYEKQSFHNCISFYSFVKISYDSSKYLTFENEHIKYK